MHGKSWARMISVATVMAAAVLSFYFQPAIAGSRWGANYFPNVELTDQYGNKHHFYDDLLKGKTVAMELIYTHCVDSCPLETARLVQVQRMMGDRVGKDVFFYSITIDPKRDTPPVLKDYAEKYHVGPGWLFLTGKKEDIDVVARKLGLYYDPGFNRDGHSVDLMIGNEPTGQWMKNNATDNPRFLVTLINRYMSFGGKWQPQSATGHTEARDIKVRSRGQYLFATRCSPCHTIGQGDSIGPDLLGVTNVRDRKWLERIIAVPEELLAEKDPLATALFKKYKEVRMPNLQMGGEAVDDLITYLKERTAAAQPVAAGNAAGNKLQQ
jgi:protein SCO1/2